MKKDISRFITLEGIDGSGKDSVLNKLSSLLFTQDISTSSLSINQTKYHNFLITYEPTTISSEGKIIHKGGNSLSLLPFSNYSPNELSDLYIKDRIKHSKFIKTTLKNNTTVLCSRYDLSTYAYQINMGSTFDYIYNQHFYNETKGSLIPNLTLFLDVSLETAINRIKNKDNKNKDNYDIDINKKSLKNTIENYHQTIQNLSTKQPNRKIIIIDSNNTLKKVVEQCVEEINKIF